MAIILDRDKEGKVTKQGEAFYNRSLPRALADAREYAQNGGHVASMPELLRGRVISPADSELWTHWFTALSEEDVGRTAAGSSVLVTVHGGGILSTPERITRAYEEGLTPQRAAKLTDAEFTDIVNGKLPDGTKIPVYSFIEFKQGVKDLPLRYAVVMDFETARKTESGYQKIDKLYDNPLFIVRAGGVKAAKAFLDKAKLVYNSQKLGNWHSFNKIDVEQSQGRPLFVGCDVGLGGYDFLDYYGRVLGVAPEAPLRVNAPGALTLVDTDNAGALSLTHDAGALSLSQTQSFMVFHDASENHLHVAFLYGLFPEYKHVSFGEIKAHFSINENVSLYTLNHVINTNQPLFQQHTIVLPPKQGIIKRLFRSKNNGSAVAYHFTPGFLHTYNGESVTEIILLNFSVVKDPQGDLTSSENIILKTRWTAFLHTGIQIPDEGIQYTYDSPEKLGKSLEGLLRRT